MNFKFLLLVLHILWIRKNSMGEIKQKKSKVAIDSEKKKTAHELESEIWPAT